MNGAARDTRLPAWLPGLAHAALRIVTGLLFMQHGAQKMLGLLVSPDPSAPSVR